MKHVITGAEIFDGQQMIADHSVLIDEQTIVQIIANDQLDHSLPQTKLDGGILAPGFIDLQVNGGDGVLLNNAPTAESVHRIVQAHRSKGVTALLPTLISDTREVMEAGIAAVVKARQHNDAVIGLHIEGPFFNLDRRGVHREDCIRPPSPSDIDWLCRHADIPMMLTLAPEQTAAGQIRQLTEAGIIVFAGHTDALADQIESALNEGLKGFTHLFNAMRPMSGREPGVVGVALSDPNSYCGIIVDNHHVHPTSVRVAHQAKAAGKMMLVSDAMATIGSNKKSFELYGETITEQAGRLINSEGKLAGSAIGLIDAVRISHQDVGLPLIECLKMASLYPAQLMKLDQQRGIIQPGYRADLVHFNDQFQVTQTWLAGSEHFHQEHS